MKIVKRIEDIQGDMWCYATRENYYALKTLGYKSSIIFSWSDIINHESYKSDDIFLFNTSGNFGWYELLYKQGIEVSFDLKNGAEKESSPNITDLFLNKFVYPDNFNIEIFKILGTGKNIEYIGIVNNIPAKWDFNGVCVNPSKSYSLYREYKQRIYTKPNTAEFHPKQKFIISSTEKMSSTLEKQGWRLATNDEIEEFKF